MFKKPMLQQPAFKKPKGEKEAVGQMQTAVISVGHKAPVLSRLVGKM